MAAPNKRPGVPTNEIGSVETGSRLRVKEFLEENLPGYVDSDTATTRKIYIDLQLKIKRENFKKPEMNAINYALWYSTIMYSRQREMIETDLANLEQKNAKISQEAERLAQLNENPNLNFGESSDEELLAQVEADMNKPDFDDKAYIVNLLRTLQSDANRIRSLEETVNMLSKARREEQLVINTPRRTPAERRLATRPRSILKTGTSAETVPRHETTAIGSELDENEEQEDPEGQENPDEQRDPQDDDARRAREAERARRAEERRRRQEFDCRTLREAHIAPFTGENKDKPFGNNFLRFLATFEEYAGMADEQTKKLELVQRLKGNALMLYYNKVDELGEMPDYDEVVDLMKGVYYCVEVDSTKLSKFRELFQREDQPLDEFYVTFKILFRNYLEVTTGQDDPTIGNGKIMCRALYQKVRKTLRDALDKKCPYMWEKWRTDPFSIDGLYDTLKDLEAALPPREVTKQRPLEN